MQYRRNENVEIAPLMEESVLYDPAGNKFCVLNRTATRLWELLDQPQGVDDLSATLCDEFSVDDGTTVERDVQETLRQLEGLGLITHV